MHAFNQQKMRWLLSLCLLLVASHLILMVAVPGDRDECDRSKELPSSPCYVTVAQPVFALSPDSTAAWPATAPDSSETQPDTGSLPVPSVEGGRLFRPPRQA